MNHDGHVTCPQRRSIERHDEINEEIWGSEEWKARKEQGIRDHPLCQECGDKTGEPTRVPHHERDAYGDPSYILLEDCRWLCNVCHDGIHAGKFKCPVCGRIASKVLGEQCWYCRPEEEKRQFRKKKGSHKAVNPRTGKWVKVRR